MNVRAYGRGVARSNTLVVVASLSALLAAALTTALVIAPPLLGWIGFAIVSLIVLGLGVAAVFAVPRMRVWPQIPAVGLDRAQRLLLVVDPRCSAEELVAIVRASLADDVAVHVVVPVRVSHLHFLTDDESLERRDAERSLSEFVRLLSRHDIETTGVVGDDKPLESMTDALGSFAATQIVLAVPPETYWMERELLAKARALAEVSVTQVIVPARPPEELR